MSEVFVYHDHEATYFEHKGKESGSALKQLDVFGTAMGTAEEFGAMLDLYAEQGLSPKINETLALVEIASASPPYARR